MSIIPIAHAEFDLQNSYGFSNVNNLGDALTLLLPAAFALAGVGIVFYFIFGAFKFLTSGGDKGAVAEARAMIMHAVIGLLMLIILFAVMKFIPEAFNLGFTIIK